MRKIILCFLLILGLTGCLAPKSFLDPKYRGIGYQDLKAPEHPHPVDLMVTGKTNGVVNPRASEYWRRQVVRVLTATRVFAFSQENAGIDKLSIVIDNIGDRGAAAGKGFVTGLTFGAVGSFVTDRYVMTVEYSRPGKPILTRTYQHVIYTTIGNASPPPGIPSVTLSEAPSLVAEDMLLHFVKDLDTESGN